MTEKDVEQLEQSIELTIPQALKQLLVTTLDSYEIEMNRYSLDEIVANLNQLMDQGVNDQRWLPHLLPIGKDTTGFTYFIDVQDSKPWLYSASDSADPFFRTEYYKKDCRFGLIL